MYLVGAPHPHKSDALRLLEQYLTARERLVTDAAVLQEILHRYVAIGRREAIQPAFDALLGVVNDVFDVTRADAESAKEIVTGAVRLSARDAIHVAIMRREHVDRILSFDRGFDVCPGIVRLHG